MTNVVFGLVGVKQEGIFVNQSLGFLQGVELRKKLEHGTSITNFADFSPYAVASVLLEFLSELPEPLLTFDASDKLVELAANNANAQQFQEVVDSVNKIHLAEFVYVLELLRMVSSQHEVNKVTPVILGILLSLQLFIKRVYWVCFQL